MMTPGRFLCALALPTLCTSFSSHLPASITTRNGHYCVDSSLLALPIPEAETTISTVTDMISSYLSDPNLEAQIEASVFADLAHICTDFINVITESTAVVRLSIVMGRIFTIAADWLPDHYIRKNDLSFDIVLVTLSLGLFIKSFLPLSYGLFSKTDRIDKEVYEVLFEPVGVSWLQFKALNAISAEWVEFPPDTLLVNETGRINNNNSENEECPSFDEAVCDEDALYWLYEGNSVITFNDHSTPYIHRQTDEDIHDPGTTGFIGIVRFLERFDAVYINAAEADTDLVLFPRYAISTGDKGAKLIRFDGPKMHELMNNDEPLASSIRALLLRGLQRKMGYMLLLLSEELSESKRKESAALKSRDASTNNALDRESTRIQAPTRALWPDD
jgi:hypothetical protein